MSIGPPSSGAARHLLPPGEKEEKAAIIRRREKEEKSAIIRGGEKQEDLSTNDAPPPSPLVGEGARRAGEGGSNQGLTIKEKEGRAVMIDKPTVLPSPPAGEGARRAGEGGFPTRSAQLKGFSRSMRQNPTEVEKLLWRLLRNRRFANHKFRRQVPLGPYILDFACFKSKLVVELDGSQHLDCKKDVARDAWLQNHGFRVLRFWNNDLMLRQKSSLDAIWHAVSYPKDKKND